MRRERLLCAALVATFMLGLAALAYAQGPGSQPQDVGGAGTVMGTVFTYEGNLKRSGSPYTGACSMRFRLYDSGPSQVGGAIDLPVTVDGGLFMVKLDFGGTAFGGEARWLETAVQCASDTLSTTLPLQELTPAPYALYSGSTGALQGQAVSSASPTSGQVLQWNGSAWAPASGGSGGGITGVYAGAGLGGGGATGDVTLTVAFSGTGAIDNVAHSDHDHWGQSWTGSDVGLTLSGGSTGLSGSGADAGVYGTGPTYGLRGNGTGAGTGVYGYGQNGAMGVGYYYGVYGVGGPTGVYGRAVLFGVYGDSSDATGVYGTGNTGVYGTGVGTGVYGSSSSTTGTGVYAQGGPTGVYGTGTGTGVYAQGGPTGVYGTGTSWGIYGTSSSTIAGGAGVYGSGNGTGVYGTATGIGLYGMGYTGIYGTGTGDYGVRGKGMMTGIYGEGSDMGVLGVSSGSTGNIGVRGYGRLFGVYGVGPATGVYGYGSTYAGYFAGNVNVTGNLTKPAGSFQIDHPLAPADKYLSHSFVESPDMKNVYDGLAVLDQEGAAWVELPAWFQTLNQDFRYQLTPIGKSAPDLYIAKKIEGNRFQIGGGTAGLEVSWQVTGIRHDAWAEAHRIKVEEDKPPEDQGKYLHPELFGQPESKRIGAGPQLAAKTP